VYVRRGGWLDRGAIEGWLLASRADGVTLPLVLGLPGPADMAKVIRIATRIGVAASSRYLRKNRGIVGAVLRRRAFRPDRLLHQLHRTIDDPVADVRGLHVYTFNQVQEAEAWRARQTAHLRGAWPGVGRPRPAGQLVPRSSSTSAATTARASPTIA